MKSNLLLIVSISINSINDLSVNILKDEEEAAMSHIHTYARAHTRTHTRTHTHTHTHTYTHTHTHRARI